MKYVTLRQGKYVIDNTIEILIGFVTAAAGKVPG